MDMHIMNTRYGIDEEDFEHIVEEAKDYAMFHGMMMRSRQLSVDTRVPLPFCLLPCPFPEKWFHIVNDLQPYLNFILHKISYSKEDLKKCLASTIEVDEFTANIFKIFEVAHNDEQVSLGLLRSDYLLSIGSDEIISGIKQVENNVISSSFGGLAPVVRDLHEFVLNRLGQKGFCGMLPYNESVSELAKGIISAWDAYENKSAVVLIVVEDVSVLTNICDQRALEYAILDYESELKILRRSFKELRIQAKLKGKSLFVDNKEVAVVYYRTGYSPQHYEPEDWETRLLMERSKAIKCPSVGMHLAGTKMVQTYLTWPNVLEKFVDSEIAKRLREVFVAQYTLEGAEGDKAIDMAMKNPECFVLKPQREGGGFNVFGEDIKSLLESDANVRKSHILMERINPPCNPNCMVLKDKSPEISQVVSELGIFGVILGNKDEIYLNNAAGHLLRSKGADSNETGVAAGFGALDSPYLE